MKLLEEAGEGGAADIKELRDARNTIESNEQTIREVGPLLRFIRHDCTDCRSSIEKYLSWKVSSNLRSTAKTSWRPVLPTSNVSLIDYAPHPDHRAPTTVIAVPPRSRRLAQAVIAMGITIRIIDVNCAKVHMTWTPVLYSLGTRSRARKGTMVKVMEQADIVPTAR